MAATRKKISEFLGNSAKTVENWEKENRFIIKFIKEYLNSNECIDEFMQTGKVTYLEKNKLFKGSTYQFEEPLLDHAFYSVKNKIYEYTSKFSIEQKSRLKDMLLKALKSIDIKLETFTIEFAKTTLLSTINGIEINSTGTSTNREVKEFSKWLEYNLSKVEIYVLIKDYKQIYNIIEK